VFVIASARTDIDIGQILFEFESVQRTTKPFRETQENNPRTIEIGINGNSGNGNLMFAGVQEVSPTLRANAKDSLMSGSGIINLPLAISIQGNIINRNFGGAKGIGISTDDISFTLTTADRHAVSFNKIVRRLTPRECERLQGFPDDYTLIPYKGKEASDAVRYHALGNSWAVPVVRWIGQRIVKIMNP
jgi:site-specific DNA-cytosine methylase